MSRPAAEPVAVLSRGLDETLAIGRAVAGLCRAGDVVALGGELGAGKTQLVRGLAAGLGLDPGDVSSPTFVFVHEYEPADPDDPDALTLVHVDAYRVTGPDDLASVGFDLDDDAFRRGCVVAVEWPARLGLPLDRHLTLRIEHAAESPDARRLTAAAGYDWAERRDALAAALRTRLPHD